MISDADRVAAAVVAVRAAVVGIEMTTEIADPVRMAVATDTRTTGAGIGISVVDADRAAVADRAVRETRVIADHAGTISSRADRCARRSYRSLQIQKV